MRAGSYGTQSTWHDLVNSGSASAQIVLTAAPGDSVTVNGWVDLEGSYTTLSHLNVNGSNDINTSAPGAAGCQKPSSEALAINGAGDIFEYNNFFQSGASARGVGLGVGFSGHPDNTVIRYNEIHDVGSCAAYDHLIYLDSGNNVQIYKNWMWNDANGWGVQLYPHPTNARVFDNVIDHAGSGFLIGNESGDTVSGNQLYNNVVTNATGLPSAGLDQGVAISDWWGGTQDPNNTFSDNDSFNNPGGVAHVKNVALSGNITADPQFVNAAGHDYAVSSSSPAAGWGLWNGSGM